MLLLPKALAITEKYQDEPLAQANGKVLLVYTNQKTNAYLKEITDLCEVERRITYHFARHTFATTVALSNGIPIESVSKILDHTNLRAWLYLAVVLDLFSRRIVGWSMTLSLERSLVIDALQMAIITRNPNEGLIHYSDRGSQYTSFDY